LPLISVVIPVFKAEAFLHELYDRLRKSLESITDDFEILLVEDCGGDFSWQIIQDLAKLDRRVKGIKFSRNFGQHLAITAGLDQCNSDWVVVMDCDLQDRPEEIPKLYAKALEGYNVVIALRRKREDSVPKRFSSWLFFKVFNFMTGLRCSHEWGNFRIISRKVVLSIRTMREQFRLFGALIEWLGYSAEFVEVKHEKRFSGISSYNFSKLWKLASEAIIAYSDKPLRIFIYFGFFISTLSFIYGGYIIYRAYFYGLPILGWSSLMVSIYLFGGILIGMMGIIGIYLHKTFEETKHRPLYIVSDVTEK
jgi:glycosyltransferase involved in cell wall biosynthesis